MESAQIIALGSNLALPQGSQALLGFMKGKLQKFLVPNHKAYGYQILHVALSSGPSPRDVNYNPRVELIAKGYKFYMDLYSEIFRNPLVAKHKNYGYHSPCKGSYVLNQFPSNVMFGMNGFHVSAWSDTGPSWPSCFFLQNRCICCSLIAKKQKYHFFSHLKSLMYWPFTDCQGAKLFHVHLGYF